MNEYNVLKYAKSGIASPDMTAYDKMRALAMAGAKYPIQTITGVPPLSFKADGRPLISWGMKGNGVQSGTPTPDNPVMPEFVGVRTGNILPSAAEQTLTSGGITIRCDGNGRYYISGTASSTSIVTFSIPDFVIPISSERDGNGTFSLFNTEASSNAYLRLQLNDAKIDDWNLYAINRTFTGYITMGGKTINQLSFRFPTGTSYDGIVSPMFTNNGILPTEFEPFGWAEKITCGEETTPVYLGQVSTVRRIKKMILDGTETVTEESANVYSIPILDTVIAGAGVSTHFVYDASTDDGQFQIESGKAVFGYDDTLENFKAFLADQYAAGTPVTIWYALATPEIGIVNEPLSKIGDYADELRSVDASITIQTVRGNNTLTVDTDLQPSSVSITGHIKAIT